MRASSVHHAGDVDGYSRHIREPELAMVDVVVKTLTATGRGWVSSSSVLLLALRAFDRA
jgi:hypothetical protein